MKKKSPRERRKNFVLGVTWALVIVFGLSCVGIIVNFGQRRAHQKTQTEVQQKTDPAQEEIKYWLSQLEKNPQDPITMSNLAYQFQKNNDSASAIKYFREALKIDPGYSFAITNLSKVYILNNNNDDAIALLADAIKQNPKNAEYNMVLSLAYMQKKDNKNAVKYAEETIKIDPGIIEAYELKAGILSGTGNKKEAAKVLKDAKDVAMAGANQQMISRIEKEIKSLGIDPTKSSKVNSESKKNQNTTAPLSIPQNSKMPFAAPETR